MPDKKIEEMTYDELIAFKNYADSQAADAKIKLAVAKTEAVQEGFYLPAADYEAMLRNQVYWGQQCQLIMRRLGEIKRERAAARSEYIWQSAMFAWMERNRSDAIHLLQTSPNKASLKASIAAIMAQGW